MRIETTPVVKTTETYVLQHFVKVSHTEELRSKGKQTEKAGKKRGTADDSKTTNTRITRNKHQLQHQHNKAVGKENPSLWPLKESDNFSEIQNKLSSSHVYQKTTSYHNQIDWRKWWGLRSDDDTDQLPNTTLSFLPLYECKKKRKKTTHKQLSHNRHTNHSNKH